MGKNKINIKLKISNELKKKSFVGNLQTKSVRQTKLINNKIFLGGFKHGK